MSNTTIFAWIVMFIISSSGLLVLYGITQPSFQNTISPPYQCLVNDSPASSCKFPSWNPPAPTNVTNAVGQIPWWKCILSTPCVFLTITGSVGGSSTAQSIWNGFSIFGYGIGVFLQTIFVAIIKLISGAQFLTAMITFLNNDTGVPYLGTIYVAFEIMLVIFGIALLKPGGHGT